MRDVPYQGGGYVPGSTVDNEATAKARVQRARTGASVVV